MSILRTFHPRVNLAFSLSEETVRRLRKTVSERYHDENGALSGLVEENIREKLEVFDRPKSFQIFRAMRAGRVVAEGENLEVLGTKLNEINVNPRSVRIISSIRLTPVVRTGLRGRKD